MPSLHVICRRVTAPGMGRSVVAIALGILLAWDNGFEARGSKVFFRFEYNDSEHMAREFFNRVLYSYHEGKGNEQDLFGPTPYGDIYDPLRIDTPKGPLPMELLRR